MLGIGSLFNHSSRDQNVAWSRDVENQCVVYTALRDIKAREELCISYGRLWFKDADEEETGEPDPEVEISELNRIAID